MEEGRKEGRSVREYLEKECTGRRRRKEVEDKNDVGKREGVVNNCLEEERNRMEWRVGRLGLSRGRTLGESKRYGKKIDRGR